MSNQKALLSTDPSQSEILTVPLGEFILLVFKHDAVAAVSQRMKIVSEPT